MVEFNYLPMDMPVSSDSEDRIEKPILTTGELGGSVTEGSRFGSFLQTAAGAFKMGASKIELATIMGGGEPGGAESYGKEARQAMREMAQVNEAEFVSTHTPTQVGNLSGFNPQQGFSDQQRKRDLDEVGKAIKFAGDVARGGAVVVHTGEFLRNMSEQEWAKEKKNGEDRYVFLGYQEEPGRASTYLVDNRDGKVLQDIRKNKPLRIPKFETADSDRTGVDIYGNSVNIKKGDWVDQDGRWLDPSDPEAIFLRVPVWNREKASFETELVGWDKIEQMTDWFNDRRKHDKEKGLKELRPEEYAFRMQLETQMLQHKGSSLFHGQRYEQQARERDELKKSLEFYEDLEKRVPTDEIWKMEEQIPKVRGLSQKFTASEGKLPSQILKEELRDLDLSLKHTRESSSAADARADELRDQISHIEVISDYGKRQSFKSFAEAGIMAMEETKQNKHIKKDIFVAPENIFPEMGFGSHPEELIELVKGSREQMVQLLTQKKVPSPHGFIDPETQNLKMEENPLYNPNMNEHEARKFAEKHIKATFDTQHLGMWKKHFVPLPGETQEQTDGRFNKWYMDQIKKLADSNIIGHVHLVDAMGAGHHHLPAGQGTLPVKDAVEYLKKKGYGGTIISEAHEENARFGPARQFTETWRHFGSPVYSTFVGGGGNAAWGQIQNAYLGQTQPPMFIYGAYSPSNEWKLWSEVQME